MPRLSIVIAAMGEIRLVERTLVTVLAHRPADAEVIVVLNGEYADPYELEGEVRFVRAPDDAPLTRCLNTGVAASRGAIVHILACGTEVGERWMRAAVQHFSDAQVAAVTPVVVDASDSAHSVSPRAVSRHISNQITKHARLDELSSPTFFAAFYRKAALKAVGEPFAPCVEGVADVDLGLRLLSAGYRTVCEPASRIMIHADMSTMPVDEFRTGREAERLFWRNASVLGGTRSLVAHAIWLAREFAMSFARPRRFRRVLGGLAAWGEYPKHVRLWHRLSIARTAMANTLAVPSHDTMPSHDAIESPLRPAA